jgi:hypothetical protein
MRFYEDRAMQSVSVMMIGLFLMVYAGNLLYQVYTLKTVVAQMVPYQSNRFAVRSALAWGLFRYEEDAIIRQQAHTQGRVVLTFEGIPVMIGYDIKTHKVACTVHRNGCLLKKTMIEH